MTREDGYKENRRKGKQWQMICLCGQQKENNISLI